MAKSSRYLIPAQQHSVETLIQRSRFITVLAPISDAETAMAFLAEVRAAHPDATHHCWAYLAGPPGSSGQVGMSDDGEPHGTAGRPMLNVLTHADVGDIAAVVVRYYGGSKLGKGGLVRAYSGGVQLALETLPTKQKITYKRVRVLLSYGQVDALKRLIEAHGVTICGQDFGVDPVFELDIPEDHYQAFLDAWVDHTGGATFIEPVAH